MLRYSLPLVLAALAGIVNQLEFLVRHGLPDDYLRQYVDEVLAVGDSAFQKKCLGKMGDVTGEGRTVLFDFGKGVECPAGRAVQAAYVHPVAAEPLVCGVVEQPGARVHLDVAR